MKYHCVFLGIDYTHAYVYQAVTVTKRDGDEVRFETGDPEADYKAACDFAREEAVRSGADAVMTSSSLNDFVFEVPGWRYDADDNLVPDPRDRIKTLEHTCEACPSQWEGLLEDGTHFYVRYRGGRFRVGFGDSLGDAIDNMTFSQSVGDSLDGYMTWEEALPRFNKALLARHYPQEDDDA